MRKFVSMDAVDQMLKAALEISPQILKVNATAIEKELPKMVKLNLKQLDEGTKNDDNPITPFYSDAYAKKKGFNIPDLKVTGDWRSSIGIDYRGSELAWYAADYKTPFLTDRYGDDILGLNKDNSEQSFENIYKKDVAFIDKVVKKHF